MTKIDENSVRILAVTSAGTEFISEVRPARIIRLEAFRSSVKSNKVEAVLRGIK